PKRSSFSKTNLFKMKKLLAISLAAAALAIALPALATEGNGDLMRSPKATSTKATTTVDSSVAIACVGSAVSTREAAIDAAVSTHQAAVQSAYTTRAAAL